MKQTLTQQELTAMAAAMELAEWGEEIEVEIVDEDYDSIGDNELYEILDEMDHDADYHNLEDEYDGQPTEYEEWQDVYGGDDWDHGQYDCMDY